LIVLILNQRNQSAILERRRVMSEHAKDRTGLKARAAFRKTTSSRAGYDRVFCGKGRNPDHAAGSHISPGRAAVRPPPSLVPSAHSKHAVLISLISFDCFSKGSSVLRG
jgi:hypothetical protein